MPCRYDTHRVFSITCMKCSVMHCFALLCHIIMYHVILCYVKQHAILQYYLFFLRFCLHTVLCFWMCCVWSFNTFSANKPHHTYIPQIRSWIHLLVIFFLHLLSYFLLLSSSPPLLSTHLNFFSSYLLFPPLFHPSHDLPFSLLHLSSNSLPPRLFSLTPSRW